jgi:predicted GTPase
MSAEDCYGEWDLWKVINQLPQLNEKENSSTDTTIEITLLGRPDVSKSSILNIFITGIGLNLCHL